MPLDVSDFAELDAPEKEYLWTLNFGPQHPATHTTLRLVLTLDGERVVHAVPHIGYLHSGFEKLGEHLDFNQYVTIVDRMNYISVAHLRFDSIITIPNHNRKIRGACELDIENQKLTFCVMFKKILLKPGGFDKSQLKQSITTMRKQIFRTWSGIKRCWSLIL